MHSITDKQLDRAYDAAHGALRFADSQRAALPAALIRYRWFDGAAHHVTTALAAFQNEDGGFGN